MLTSIFALTAVYAGRKRGSLGPKPGQDDPLPDAFDWRNVNGQSFVTPVLNQMVPSFCGSACAAFNHASYISDRIKIAAARGDPAVGKITGGDVILSPQVLINCAKPWGKKGEDDCSVGGSKASIEYLTENGIPDITCAPFVGKKEECSAVNTCYQYSPLDDGATKVEVGDVALWGVSDNGSVPANDTDAMRREIWTNGPVQCSSDAQWDVIATQYAGGVISDNTPAYKGWCSTGTKGHSISVVGWGTDNAGTDYWAVRTSWGRDWGEQGFFRIERGVQCLTVETKCNWATPKRFPNSPPAPADRQPRSGFA